MKLNPDIPDSHRFLSAMGNLLLVLIATALFWLGLNSLLVGLAYDPQKGCWLPILTGASLTLGGIWLLGHGVQSLSRMISQRPSSKDRHL